MDLKKDPSMSEKGLRTQFLEFRESLVNVDFNEVVKVYRRLVDMSSNRVISCSESASRGC